jgi:hypothetical protein
MKRFWLTILIFVFALSACKSNSSSKSSSFNIFGDDTQQVVEIIKEMNNNELKQIKALYKENQGRTEELKAAFSGASKDLQKFKTVSGDLMTKIDDGLTLGESAYSKIEKAEGMNINQTYKDYLRLKKESLRSLLDAFQYRKEAAQILRDGFGSGDPKQIEKAIAAFKEKEENFQKYKDEGLDLSQQANQLAKDAAKAKR